MLRFPKILPVAIALCFAAGCSRENDRSVVVMVGTIERDRLEMLASASEILVEQPVVEGGKVAAGAVVARLDDSRLKQEVAALKSARDAEKARLDLLEAGYRTEEIAQARAAYQATVARVEITALDLQRAQQLVTVAVETQSLLDSARSAHAEAVANKQKAAENLRLFEAGPRGEEIRAQRAAFESADARMREAQVRLDQLTIKAPCDCTVSTLPFRVGERVLAGVSVATLRAQDRTFARVFIPERAQAVIRAGREGSATVDGVERKFKVRVRTVASEASFTPFYALTDRERERLVFAAKVDLIEPEARDLPVGVPVTVRIPLE